MAFLAWSRGRIPVPECIYSHRVRNQVWAYIARVHCEAAGCPWVTKQPAVVSVPLWRYEPRTAEIPKRTALRLPFTVVPPPFLSERSVGV